MEAFLEELALHQITLPVASDTRVCTTLLDGYTGDMTELIEPAGEFWGGCVTIRG